MQNSRSVEMIIVDIGTVVEDVELAAGRAWDMLGK